jgi:hypothetical protein
MVRCDRGRRVTPKRAIPGSTPRPALLGHFDGFRKSLQLPLKKRVAANVSPIMRIMRFASKGVVLSGL